MAQFPFVDLGVGLIGQYGPEAGKGQGPDGRKAVCGGFSRRRRSGEAEQLILYLIKAGLLPVRFRRPMARVGVE